MMSTGFLCKKKLSAPGKQLLRKDVKFTFYFNEAKAAS